MRTSKGSSDASYIKHEQIKRLALAQTAVAMKALLRNGGKVRVVDMHAGDGLGVEPAQPAFFFLPQDSPATPLITYEVACYLRDRGIGVDHVLCEINRATRRRLEPLARRFGSILIGDHAGLPDAIGYRWSLYINDPNGPAGHGDETLARVAMNERAADFIIVSNESAIRRIIGRCEGEPRPDSHFPWDRTQQGLDEQRTQVEWRLSPREWAIRLRRRFALVSRHTFGANAMNGRILLVTNYCQRCPVGYDRIDTEAAVTGPPDSASPEPQADAAAGSGRSDRSVT